MSYDVVQDHEGIQYHIGDSTQSVTVGLAGLQYCRTVEQYQYRTEPSSVLPGHAFRGAAHRTGAPLGGCSHGGCFLITLSLSFPFLSLQIGRLYGLSTGKHSYPSLVPWHLLHRVTHFPLQYDSTV